MRICGPLALACMQEYGASFCRGPQGWKWLKGEDETIFASRYVLQAVTTDNLVTVRHMAFIWQPIGIQRTRLKGVGLCCRHGKIGDQHDGSFACNMRD
jgi:hypothetical protein